MIKPTSTRAIEEATDASWQEWCAFLDGQRAAQLDHNAIVKKARTFKKISGWWAQSIAVAYEQHIGRRKPGQRSDGLFNVSISRTIKALPEPAYASWCSFAASLSEVDGQLLAAEPTTSATPKRLYWRCKFEGGSRAIVSFESKGAERVLIAIEHQKIALETQTAEKKRAWAALLDECLKS
ncbi:MAG: hypothetical protein ACR2QH_04250 [Geminicoccaceae bacterium]|jgi:hypothetical protein